MPAALHITNHMRSSVKHTLPFTKTYIIKDLTEKSCSSSLWSDGITDYSICIVWILLPCFNSIFIQRWKEGCVKNLFEPQWSSLLSFLFKLSREDLNAVIVFENTLTPLLLHVCSYRRRLRPESSLLLLGLSDLGLQGITSLLGVAQQHGGVGLVEDGVVHCSVSHT